MARNASSGDRLQRTPASTPGRLVRDLAYVEVTSTEFAREINRDIILELIRKLQPVARVDLARHSGLQNSTVSSIVEQLLEEGWIREGEAVKTARGRRPTQITLNDQLAMLTADVHLGRAVVAAVDLNGRVLSRTSVPISPGAAAGVRDLTNALLHLRDQHPDKTFEGIGVCLPGRIDADTGYLMLAPNLDWLNFNIIEAIQSKLKLRVELENNANACLLAELWFGHLDGVRNAVLLAVSEGVGASLLADGHLITGHLGLAGEFGHICYDPAGPQCGCGRLGCWEVFGSTTAALRHYRDLSPKSPDIDFQQLCALANKGDANARKAIERQASAIGRGLRMVTAAMAPQSIVFTGDFAQAWSIAEPILRAECTAGLLGGECPKLVCTTDGELAHLLGAAAVVLQRHTGYYRSRTSHNVKM
jgi:predicted NBD/HSP70 family sugar kinase